MDTQIEKIEKLLKPLNLDNLDFDDEKNGNLKVIFCFTALLSCAALPVPIISYITNLSMYTERISNVMDFFISASLYLGIFYTSFKFCDPLYKLIFNIKKEELLIKESQKKLTKEFVFEFLLLLESIQNFNSSEISQLKNQISSAMLENSYQSKVLILINTFKQNTLEEIKNKICDDAHKALFFNEYNQYKNEHGKNNVENVLEMNSSNKAISFKNIL